MGPAAGFDGSEWKMGKLDGSGEVLAGIAAVELAQAAVFSLPRPLPTLLTSTSAQTLTETWQQAT